MRPPSVGHKDNAGVGRGARLQWMMVGFTVKNIDAHNNTYTMDVL